MVRVLTLRLTDVCVCVCVCVCVADVRVTLSPVVTPHTAVRCADRRGPSTNTRPTASTETTVSAGYMAPCAYLPTQDGDGRVAADGQTTRCMGLPKIPNNVWWRGVIPISSGETKMPMGRNAYQRCRAREKNKQFHFHLA